MKRKLPLVILSILFFMLTANAESVMTLTTSKTIGETLKLGINCSSTDVSSIWIDLNANEIEDANEKVTYLSNQYCTEYRISSQTISIHGNITSLNCTNNDLTSLVQHENTSLQYLYCTENDLKVLDVSKLESLKRCDCFNNQLVELDFSKNPKLYVIYCDYNALTSLNVANGNNLNVQEFRANNNPDLTSIKVDPDFNPDYDGKTKWIKDAITSWSNVSDGSETTDIDLLSTSKANIWTGSNTIYFSNFDLGEMFIITDLSGKILENGIVSSNEFSLNLAQGFYIVKVNNATFKIIVSK